MLAAKALRSEDSASRLTEKISSCISQIRFVLSTNSTLDASGHDAVDAEQDVRFSEDRVAKIDIEVFISHMRSAARSFAADDPPLFTANIVIFDASTDSEDLRLADESTMFGLTMPPMFNVRWFARPPLTLLALIVRRLLNPFSWMQRQYNRAVLSLIEQLNETTSRTELNSIRDRESLRKLEKTVVVQARTIAALERRLDAIEGTSSTIHLTRAG